MSQSVDPDEHRVHIDNAAYQAAIERAAIAPRLTTDGKFKATADIERKIVPESEWVFANKEDAT